MFHSRKQKKKKKEQFFIYKKRKKKSGKKKQYMAPQSLAVLGQFTICRQRQKFDIEQAQL